MSETTTDWRPDRAAAWELLNEHTKKEGLIKHALGVEAAMRGYAKFFGISEEETEKWAVTGLLHDFDYEKYPDPKDHPYRGVEILEQLGYPEDVRTAILGHAEYTGVPRETQLAKVLYACDELSGFCVAVALVRPSKAIADVKVKSVKKKLKDKAFARGVNRDEVRQGAEELGRPLEEHIATVIEALQAEADALGL